MRAATDTTGGMMWILPDYVGPGIVILFFLLVFLLTTVLAVLWLVFYRG